MKIDESSYLMHKFYPAMVQIPGTRHILNSQNIVSIECIDKTDVDPIRYFITMMINHPDKKIVLEYKDEKTREYALDRILEQLGSR